MTDCRIVIVAAGSGSRYGADLPKQFCNLEGRPVLMWTIDGFRRVFGNDADITLVLSESMMPLWQEMCVRHGFSSPTVVAGGSTRWHSVHNALSASPGHTGVTLVHDGARPVTDASVLREVAETALTSGACVPVVPVTDSLRVTLNDGRTEAVDRARFRAVQTPQGFRSDILEAAYSLGPRREFTDDASVVEAAGTPVIPVPGNPDNIKITNPGDIDIAALYMRRRGLTDKP